MVTTIRKPLYALTAGELMSTQVVMIPQEMSLCGAARLLGRAHVHGAPVIDAMGKCIGVVSATDFLHWMEKPLARTSHVHNSPCNAWQIVEENHDATVIGDVMTRDVVKVNRLTRLADLARMMLDAHLHRVIVVDDDDRPVGVVSATDVLAAVVRAEPKN